MKARQNLWHELGIAVIACSVLVASVSLLWRHNLLLFSITLVEGTILLRLWHDRYDPSFLLMIGGMGSIAEAVFVRSGAWHYANPALLGVPLWFPAALGTAGLIGGRLARALARLWEQISPSHRRPDAAAPSNPLRLGVEPEGKTGGN
ncbi:MAG TPA: hypothetical protein ENN99_16305 [Chloroflexi bacterium]|nr:hypothetical protein [Chloroflexota bacterium]